MAEIVKVLGAITGVVMAGAAALEGIAMWKGATASITLGSIPYIEILSGIVMVWLIDVGIAYVRIRSKNRNIQNVAAILKDEVEI